MRIEQAKESRVFKEKARAEIEAVEAVLGQAVVLFLRRYDNLPESMLGPLRAGHAQGLAAFSLQLRRIAADFGQIHPSRSSGYWELVDGLNFWTDAVGVHWPYMSLEQRETYLAWAMDEARAACSRFEVACSSETA